MTIVQNIKSLLSQFQMERMAWEPIWRDVVSLAMPAESSRYDFMAGTSTPNLTGFEHQPRVVERSREIYDSTIGSALDRFSSGMLSLNTPRGQKWQEHTIDDPFGYQPADLEREWLDLFNNYIFSIRYDARSGFEYANRRAIRAACGVGTGVVYINENLGRAGIDPKAVPAFYTSLPIAELYLGCDGYYVINRCIRLFTWSASKAVNYFGEEKLSQKVRDAAKDAKKSETPFSFIHATLPREEFGDKKSDWAFNTFWIESDTDHLIDTSGFGEFPFIVYHLDRPDGSAYGTSPTMGCLPDAKSLNAMAASQMRAMAQRVEPPMATTAGVFNSRLNLNPGKVNPGYLGSQGQLLAQPMFTVRDGDLGENLIEQRRKMLQTSMYTPLFQALIDNPSMTATQALMIGQEKGDLLGPPGASLGLALAQTAERENGIIERKGAFRPGMPLEPPASLQGRSFSVRSSSPLDRLRRQRELDGADGVFARAAQIAQVDPEAALEISDRVDAGEYIRLAQEIGGAPAKLLRTDDEFAERQAARKQAQQNAMLAQAAPGLAKAAKDGSGAMAEMANMVQQQPQAT